MDLTAKYHLQREKAFALTHAEGQHFTNITLKSRRGLALTLWASASYVLPALNVHILFPANAAHLPLERQKVTANPKMLMMSRIKKQSAEAKDQSR